MTYEKVLEALNNIHPGSFVRIGYYTELPLKSSFSKQGYKILRASNSTVRTGINYYNIQSVIEEKSKKEQQPVARKKTLTSVIKNKIYKNIETEQLYLRVYPTSKGTNKVNTYFLISPDTSIQMVTEISPEMKNMVRDSYFTEKFRPISMIKLENLYRIGNYGVLC